MDLNPDTFKQLLTEDANKAFEQFKAFHSATGTQLKEKDEKLKTLSIKEQEAAKLAEERAQLAAKLKVFEAIGDPAKAIEAVQTYERYKELGDPDQLKRIRDEYSKMSDTFKQQAALFGQSLEEKTKKVEETEQKASQMSEEVRALMKQNEKLDKQYKQLAEAFAAEQTRVKEATIKSELTSTLSALNVSPALQRAAFSLWRGQVSLDETGVPVVVNGEERVALKDAITAWADTSEGKAFIMAPRSSGELEASGVESKSKITPEDQYKNKDGTLNWTLLTQGLSRGDETAHRLMQANNLN
jgi:hypothetical protein